MPSGLTATPIGRLPTGMVGERRGVGDGVGGGVDHRDVSAPSVGDVGAGAVGLTATPECADGLPTGMVAMTVLVAVSITDTCRRRVGDVGAGAVGVIASRCRGGADGDGGGHGVGGGVDRRSDAEGGVEVAMPSVAVTVKVSVVSASAYEAASRVAKLGV